MSPDDDDCHRNEVKWARPSDLLNHLANAMQPRKKPMEAATKMRSIILGRRVWLSCLEQGCCYGRMPL